MARLNWVQILACGIAGIVGSLGATAIVARTSVWAALSAIDAGEWLQAAAAIIGVFLTIQGTLWLEERKRKRERVEEQRLIREALIMLDAVLPTVSEPLDADMDLRTRVLTTQAHFELVRVGMDSLVYARQNYRVRSYNLWNSLGSIDVTQTMWRERITNEERLVRGNNVTANVLAICREQLEAYTGELVQPVKAAREALAKEQA